jgi:hypothetical protein
MTSLTDLANRFKSDKGNTYACAHHYTPKYEELLNILKDQTDTIRLLEIGLCRNGGDTIPSLMMWKEFLNKGHFTGFDINSVFLRHNGQYDNIEIKVGDQSNTNDLQKLKTHKYNIIIDDGYHASKHQQISFKTLWDSVENGGYYVIEDLHWQPEPESCMPTKKLFESWALQNYISSEYISAEEVAGIVASIEKIEFYDSKSVLWGNAVKNALVYIKKQSNS